MSKYKSPKTRPTHQDYSAKGNLPKGTKPKRSSEEDPFERRKREAGIKVEPASGYYTREDVVRDAQRQFTR